MKVNKRLTVLLATALAASAALSACAKDDSPSASGSASPSAIPTAGSSASASPSAAPAADPFGKYDPPITVTTVRSVDASYKFPDGDSLDNNIWTRLLSEQYGINVKNNWVVDAAQAAEKLNVTIASGDLPDFLSVNKSDLQKLVDAGQVEDLTSVFEQFASPSLKAILDTDEGISKKSATFDGKLMAIPVVDGNGGVAQSAMLWVRTDWLEKLSLPEPKTMDDVLRIADAFANKDPDGNGKKDTVGLGLNNEIYDRPGNLMGFFNGYHAFVNNLANDFWIQDASGKLTYGAVQPEMKAGLKTLQELYAKGVIDKEFSVKPWAKVAEEVAAGKVGMMYGYMSDAASVFKGNRDNDPKAQWQAFPIVSVDDKPALAMGGPMAFNYYVVKKGFKNPEALIKLLNVYIKEYYETYSGADNPYKMNADTGVQAQKFAPAIIGKANENLLAYQTVQKEFQAGGDGSKLPFPASIHFERITNFNKGDDSMWFADRIFGPKGSFGVIDYYNNNQLYVNNAFQGAPTPAMVEKNATLSKMLLETTTRIIMGASPVDDFDKFVSDWHKLGGDQMTAEANAWYDKNK